MGWTGYECFLLLVWLEDVLFSFIVGLDLWSFDFFPGVGASASCAYYDMWNMVNGFSRINKVVWFARTCFLV